MIVYTPGATWATTNVTLGTPAATVHELGLLTGVPVIEQLVSIQSRAAPLTLIESPGKPCDGDNVIVGAARTFPKNAVSAETNIAMRSMSKVTAYRVRRNASNSKHTSLKLFD